MWLTFDVQRGSFPEKSLKLVTSYVVQVATQWAYSHTLSYVDKQCS